MRIFQLEGHARCQFLTILRGSDAGHGVDAHVEISPRMGDEPPIIHFSPFFIGLSIHKDPAFWGDPAGLRIFSIQRVVRFFRMALASLIRRAMELGKSIIPSIDVGALLGDRYPDTPELAKQSIRRHGSQQIRLNQNHCSVCVDLWIHKRTIYGKQLMNS